MKKIIRIIGRVVIVFLIMIPLTACSDSTAHRTNTCESCGRSWEAGDSGGNFMSIANTGMCVNCYENFKWAENALGNDY